MRNLKLFFVNRYGIKAANDAFTNVQNLIINTFKSAMGVMSNEKQCFELYGFDVMFDSELKPWLIELNMSPNMSAGNDADRQLKADMIDDALNIIDMEGM